MAKYKLHKQSGKGFGEGTGCISVPAWGIFFY